MLLRAGRYETLRPIASGGMATVYLGRALGGGGFERLVAIKVLHPHVADEPEFVAMFLDEARLAAQIRHPNVVATIDLVQDPLFLVMEYVEGPSLHVLLRTCRKQRQPFPLGIALRIFLDMLAGLHAAHELLAPGGEPLNLVHRDVSPQNVLVGADGISRLTDFGVARAETRISSTRGGALKGKLGYMSPEQVKSQPVDRRSDVYAAGAVLWEMLTGERLFKADNEAAMIAQILAGPTTGPRAVAAAVPEALDAACMRALTNDPADRYPTAAAFADAIERAVLASSGLAIASSRAVGTLVKGLGLHVLPEAPDGQMSSSRDPAQLSTAQGATPAGGSTGSPLVPAGTAVGAASAVSVASMAARDKLSSLADVLEPASSTTGVGGVVAEPPARSRVVRPTLIAAGVGALLAIATGLFLFTGGRHYPSADGPETSSAAPASREPLDPQGMDAPPSTAPGGASTAPEPASASAAVSASVPVAASVAAPASAPVSAPVATPARPPPYRPPPRPPPTHKPPPSSTIFHPDGL